MWDLNSTVLDRIEGNSDWLYPVNFYGQVEMNQVTNFFLTFMFRLVCTKHLLLD